ncbi:MAG: methyltransferase domain-containing protein [Candidatus Methanoperedens sp.]|nr:methyltransferase domain-containing protein [Candidatus Methanoperedens sp.]
MFGSYFGTRDIVELMVDHPIAKLSYSELERKIIKKYGHIIFRLFGYPLGVSSRQRAKVIIEYLNPQYNETVLDVGCGIGYYSFELANKFGCKVSGIDMDVDDIQLAKKIKNITQCSNVYFNVENALNLEFPDNTFEKIMLNEVLEHIHDDKKALAEMHRVLKPNGYIVISTPHAENIEEYYEQKIKKSHRKDIHIKGGHVRNGYSLQQISEILDYACFDVVEYCYISKKFTINVGFPLFLLAYPISMLDMFYNKTGKGIILKAKKR